jgi:hypothetical protein
VTRGAALTGALMATLAAPATWALGLAAFVVRGGIVLVAIPVLVIPTPVGIGNFLAPTLMSVAFGQVTVGMVLGGVALGAGLVGWVCIGGWLAALLEAEAARIVARDEDVVALAPAGPVAAPSRGDERWTGVALRRGLEAARILVVRLIAYVPLAIALAWGSVRIVLETYRELTNPVEISTPVVIRVVRDVPEVIVLIFLAWMVGEVVGALAARRIVLAGDGVVAALRAALAVAARRPLTTLARWAIPLAVLAAVLVPSILAASATWGAVRAATGGPDAFGLFIAILAFVSLWLIGLLLIAVVSAWRAAVWTVAVVASPELASRARDPRAEGWPSTRHPGAMPPV